MKNTNGIKPEQAPAPDGWAHAWASRNIAMLSQIAAEVEDWCDSEECTTLRAVRLMKLELLHRRTDELEVRLRSE